jgi:phosphate-selective porin OprO and OprP
MRSLTKCFLSLLLLMGLASFAGAQGKKSADKSSESASAGATKEEVEQLRKELAVQRQTIEQLKAMVQQLIEVKSQPPAADGAHVVNAIFVQPASNSGSSGTETPVQKPAEKKESGASVVAGWNGEHFYIKSADGQFQIQPYGYVQTDYRAYKGDGAPSDTFVIRRARLGFLGNYGKHYDFAVLIDGAASNGISLRDLYLTIKPRAALQFQVGQFKEPFAQDVMVGVTNIDFVERSFASLLYPSASTAYRSPGVVVRGDISGGVMQYWLGAFNGKGILTNNTTNEPEVVGRVRFYPFKKKKDHMFQGLAFGGSIAHGRARSLSNETSFAAANPDAAYTFFPSFLINGPVERFNGEATWTHGPWAIRAEYDQLQQFRRGVGSAQSGGLGFTDLPAVVAKAGYVQATYLLTGEARPENGTPKVKHPVLGPEVAGGSRGWGAWELAFRYDKIQAKEPGLNQLTAFTPGLVPTISGHTDAFTGGVNWYLNNWIKYMADFGVDRLRQPSTIGALPQNYFVVLQRLQFRF